MANMIKIKKGLDIKLEGHAAEQLVAGNRSDVYSICPDDYHGIVPKLIAKPGDRVLAGTPLMVDKNCPEIQFVSPVSGEVLAVNRGERRKILDICIKADSEIEYVDFGKKNIASMSADEIKASMLQMGLWAFVKQRPYDVIANPSDSPRDIFVTGFDSAPLAPNMDFVINGEEANFQLGLDALKKLTNGKVYLGVRPGSKLASMKGVEILTVEGPHPASNVGVQIANVSPVNKGEVVWTLNGFDLILIGRALAQGKTDFTRVLPVAGSEVAKAVYTKAIIGASISSIVADKVKKEKINLRYISGNVLTGKKVAENGFLSSYAQQITVIPEGDDVHELFGWAMPGFGKFSVNHSFFTWIVDAISPKKEYRIDARLQGGRRAIIMSNEYDRVLPMDILPEFLIKAVLAFDIDKMENLGIYEVAPEDFALCEFVDTSKLEIQHIIRTGLDQLRKEMN
ncbi:MAG: Na(+)-translocating NADH-quinone reductase subunit A [Bacteroidales bacterium]